MKDLVTFEQAKALKELGFDLKINRFRGVDYYTHKGELNGGVSDHVRASIKEGDNYDGRFAEVAAPTIYQAAKYLRGNYFVYIVVEPDFDSHRVHTYTKNSTTGLYEIYDDEGCYMEYEEALSRGITSAIKLINQTK